RKGRDRRRRSGRARGSRQSDRGPSRGDLPSRRRRLRRSRARFRQGLSRQSRRHARVARSHPRNGRRLPAPPRLYLLDRGVRRALFAPPFPPPPPDDSHLTPLTSYGTQKAIGEALIADYPRRGFCDGVGIRLPSIVVRPGKPNKAASGFFSGIIREPLAGLEAVLPVPETVVHTHASPRAAVGFLIHA